MLKIKHSFQVAKKNSQITFKKKTSKNIKKDYTQYFLFIYIYMENLYMRLILHS